MKENLQAYRAEANAAPATGRRLYGGLLSFFLCFCMVAAQGQSGDITAIRNSFEKYRSTTMHEKLFLHLDRPVYVSGETMWFKLYNLDGTRHRLLDLSKVAYVEVLDEAKRAVLQGKIPLKQGTGKGSFILPLTLTSGNYTVRAYTSWMKNFSPDFYFEQSLAIVNTHRNAGLKPVAEAAAYALQFFPEGGRLVAGIESKVAFKATDTRTGKGIAFEGEVLDQQGNVVARFEPLKFGLGHFSFTPEATGRYKVVARMPGGRELNQQLPQVRQQGYVLKLEEAGATEVLVKVSGSGLPAEQLYLLGHARNQVAVAAAGSLQNGELTFRVPKADMAEGINHFTLFNSRRQPLCERLYFKRPVTKLQVEALSDKQQYGTRQPVTLEVTTKSTAGKAAAANLSLSVFRLDTLQQGPLPDISSYVWLSSDLKGTIENPEYYLNTTGAEADQALDNLMLTHGWSRFRWAEVLSPQQPVYAFQPELNGHIIRGKLTHTTSGAPAQNIYTYLGAPGKHVRFYQAMSGADGTFQHEVKDFYGYKEVVLQTNQLRDSTYLFRVSSPFSDKFSTTKLPDFQLSESLLPELTQRHREVQVQNAYYEKFREVFYAPGIDSSAFYGQPDDRYLLDDYIRFTKLEEVLHEYVTPVQPRKRRDSWHLQVLDRPNRAVFQDNPLVLLDGVPVFNMNRVMEIDPLKVKTLDVVSQKYFFGPRTYNGIVSLRTYQGDLGGFSLDPRALLLEYEGLQLEREFFAPAYATPEQSRSRLPDLRNLLHWSPELLTGADGKTKTSFFTSDQPGTYLVLLQGVSADGQAGSKVIQFEVKQAL